MGTCAGKYSILKRANFKLKKKTYAAQNRQDLIQNKTGLDVMSRDIVSG